MALNHAKAGEVIDLTPMGPAIVDAQTSAITKNDQFETIRLIIHAGVEIAEHRVPGKIILHCLEGRVLLGLEQGATDLGANQWIYLEGSAPHSLKALEDTSLLLTIFFP